MEGVDHGAERVDVAVNAVQPRDQLEWANILFVEGLHLLLDGIQFAIDLRAYETQSHGIGKKLERGVFTMYSQCCVHGSISNRAEWQGPEGQHRGMGTLVRGAAGGAEREDDEE